MASATVNLVTHDDAQMIPNRRCDTTALPAYQPEFANAADHPRSGGCAGAVLAVALRELIG